MPGKGMNMKITREFAPGNRYPYDFGPCSYANGFAQVDTDQDASHFGNWANPSTLVIFSYCEGDTTHIECESEIEFALQLREMCAWQMANGFNEVKIDPGFDPEMRAAFERLHLGDMLH